MRRNERARRVLDAVELGLRRGQTPELALTSIAKSGDRSFGKRFYDFVNHLETGMRLTDALARVPQLLPPQVIGMLKAGERIENVGKVLPACWQLLRDGVSQARSALNYVILIVFVATPPLVLVPIVLHVKVLPKYREVLAGMSGAQLPGLTRMIFAEHALFTAIQVASILFLWVALLTYIGGPRLRRVVDHFVPGLMDRFTLLLPWRRKRLQRDFSTVLAMLLDTGVPESESVGLAAEATGNRVMIQRAEQAAAALGQGVKLPEALKAIDPQGELHWRIRNAVYAHGGFTGALNGWHEALDAKAFQLEQAAAQVTTTVLVLLNGLVVGCFVIGVFLGLVQLLNRMTLW